MPDQQWFVYVDAEYYAETHIVTAETAEQAAALALEQTQGNTYARYEDEGRPHPSNPRYRYGDATPACAVVLLADVIFIGSENRVAHLREEDDDA